MINDGLLPADTEILGVGSRGIRVRVGNEEIEIRETGSGVQSTVALVIDLLHRIRQRFGALDVRRTPGGVVVTHSGVVLIDEPEVHLHPAWQQKIGFWFKTRFPNIQFIVATHSPFVCQAADAGGLIRLTPLGVEHAAEPASKELYRTVVNGAVDEVVLSSLFGLEHTYSDQSEQLRAQLARLEAKELRGKDLTPRERRQVTKLRRELPSSGLARVEQATRRLKAGS